MLNATHNPSLRSWVASAQQPQGDFPIQNLPWVVFTGPDQTAPRIGVGIGDSVVDVAAALATPGWPDLPPGLRAACAAPNLNALMAQPPQALSALRAALSAALSEGSPQQAHLESLVLPQAGLRFELPAQIGDYTDFFASIHHATAVGKLLRPDNPLLPNYRWVPIAYHGRSSSVVVSGTPVHRPSGQVNSGGQPAPVFQPSRRLDYELEVAMWIGGGNPLGQPIPIARAEQHLFGLGLLNDWSARDMQAWEYQPLGPFLAKSFATTVSPWVITQEALAPFRCPWARSGQDDTPPLPYLQQPGADQQGAFDVRLSVDLSTAVGRAAGLAPQRLSTTSLRHAWWTLAQLITHHTSNGCPLRPGDLLGSGTQSGPAPEEAGSLLELTQGGRQPITLAGGETRSFLQDGDCVVLSGWCEAPGAVRIGLGTCVGTVLAGA